ncbi:MAG: 7-cyano-7-deazaguanine synthase QueC [Dehalococcoidia bacterium]|nr:MAG: 7-cyano-7-deazaguanine synthase QueC [Dehalococcoidia bacterium]
MRKVGVILLSGGLDSTTVAAYAKKQGYELIAITLHYGQKHTKEVESAKKVAEVMGIKQEVIDISFFKKLAWYSALTSTEDFKVPKQRDSKEMAKDIPITYVPLRNTFFITIAAAFLESEVLNLIENEKVDPAEAEASIFIAADTIDYSGYPDCRPEFYEKMTRALFEGTKLGAQYNKQINIQTPIILKTKAEIVSLAMELKAPLEYTWSCYEGGEVPCGKCDSCILRAKGFAEVGSEDPLIVRLDKDGKIAKSK